MNNVYEKQESLLKITGVNLSYSTKTILRDINLEVHNIVRPGVNQGQVVALLGPSGVGKTQLFRCISGLQNSSSGEITLERGGHKAVKSGDIGVVFQNYPLLNHRTIWSNLKLAASKLSKTSDEIKMLMERFGILDKINRYPSQLSGGQRQRVAIIQQMLCSQHFLLMDEPFSGLDPIMRDEVCKLMLEVSIVDELNTTIFTTHDIESAVKIADTVWVMGFERDAAGVKIPGARVIKEIDLISRGLAWNPDVIDHPNFFPTVKEITKLFV